jgi:diguanylate cyclase (GGDEF)-like protein
MHDTQDPVFDAAPTPMAQLDRALCFVRVNPAYAAATGDPGTDLPDQAYFDTCPDIEIQALFCHARDTGVALSIPGSPASDHDAARRRDGCWDRTLTPLKNPAGAVTGLLLTLRDATPREHAIAAMTARKRAERDLQLAHSAISKSSTCFYWLSPQGHFATESYHRRRDGTIIPIEANANYGSVGDEEYTFCFVQDISERRAAEQKIRSLAFYDALTGLPNRRLLMDRIQQALGASARSGSYGAVLFIDLDNFKCLNDSMGHEIGDLLLREVGERLRTIVCEADTVARLGGDEFVVMVPALSTEPYSAESLAGSVADRALDLLNRPYRLRDHEHSTSCSIGISLFNGRYDLDDGVIRVRGEPERDLAALGRVADRIFQAVTQDRPQALGRGGEPHRRGLVQAEVDASGLDESQVLGDQRASAPASTSTAGWGPVWSLARLSNCSVSLRARSMPA